MTEQELATASAAIVADLANTGGGTYVRHDLHRLERSTGYAVGIGGVTFAANAFDARVAGWLMAAVAGEYMTDYVGTWLEGQTVYLDAVVVKASLDDALLLAYQTGQAAIYDFKNEAVINVGDEEPMLYEDEHDDCEVDVPHNHPGDEEPNL